MRDFFSSLHFITRILKIFITFLNIILVFRARNGKQDEIYWNDFVFDNQKSSFSVWRFRFDKNLKTIALKNH